MPATQTKTTARPTCEAANAYYTFKDSDVSRVDSFMHYLMQHVEQYLMSCRELTAFCSQNGWIDNDSLHCEILEQNDHEVILFVQFEEILMDGSGCAPGRIPCQGRLRLTLDHYGQVNSVQLF